MIISIVTFLLLLVCVLLSVAFLTLFERKILGYIHIRKGPNVVGYWGLLQPFSDALKLFSKNQFYPYYSNYLIYYLSPVVNLFISLVAWMVLPYFGLMFSFNYSLLFFLCCTSMGVYSLLGAGWSSNSKYSMLGVLRCVAQTISYEVSLALIIICICMLVFSYDFFSYSLYQRYLWFVVFILPLGLIWVTSMIAETNRAPFDFAEGESELVSGFNIEYGSGGFAMLFMAEYSSILLMSAVFSLILMGGVGSDYIFYFEVGFIMYLFIWVRGSLPRFRYDKLMFLAWKAFLPIVLFFIYFVMIFFVV